MMNSFADRIESIIGPSLESMGLAVVRIIIGGEKRKRLQIMIERSDDTGVSLDDCAQASRTISALLDVEDPIPENYLLEVSSPGLDRPLVKLKDYNRFQGRGVYLELHTPLEGRRRFSGKILMIEGEEISLEMEEDGKAIVKLPYSDIQKAKLVPEVTFKKIER